MKTEHCNRAGCGGVVADGYCDTCGLAPAPPGSAPARSAPAAPPPRSATAPTATLGPHAAAANGAKCVQPGCDGTIQDGYCDKCGLAGFVTPARATVSLAKSAPKPKLAGSAAVPSVRSKRTRSGESRRVTARTGSTTRSHRIGAGLVDVPPVVLPDPKDVVLANPQVAPEKRFCASCGEAVGRDRAGREGRMEGFCPACGHRFSFSPKLQPDDVVAGQYKVVGCLAHGGLGWIYLARDMHVSERWVVLKGLLDAGDEDAMAAAVAERRFLASVEHPSIVKIFNFVQHEDAGYIVMEYVGGPTLKAVLKERRANAGRTDPLPVTQAIAYMLEVLPAFAYLHRIGLLYCDFKPDNVVLQGDAVKLIDLGGVRRADDDDSAVFGTAGYQAPEIAQMGPTVASDVYTVARTLAVLILDVPGYQSTYKYTLPPTEEHDVLVQHESLLRFLQKATAERPDDRFQSADEMAEQLLGVLREIVAGETGAARPARSRLFNLHADTAAAMTTTAAWQATPGWTALPRLRVDPEDPAAAQLAALPDVSPSARHDLLEGMYPRTVEVELALAYAELDVDDAPEALHGMDRVEQEDPWDWRVDWIRGCAAIARGDLDQAWHRFDRVYSDVPGELAPKLALALTAELAADLPTAIRLYDLVARTDPSYTVAISGLARCRARAGDRAGAVVACQLVARTSSAYISAQIQATRLLINSNGVNPPSPDELQRAAQTVDRLGLDAQQHAALARELLETALALLWDGKLAASQGVTLLGHPCDERGVRLGLERVFRDLARLSTTTTDRVSYVELANRVRPITPW
jgi:serine/threonine-protein kinase PknG